MRKGLKIRSTLLLSFLLIAAIGGVMGGLGMYYLDRLSHQTSRILQETSAPLKRVFMLYSSVLEVEVYARDLLLMRGEDLDKLLDSFAGKASSIESEAAELIEGSPEGELKTSLQEFQLTWEDFKASLVFLTFGIQDEGEEGERHQSVDFMYSLMEGKGQALRSGMEKIVDGYINRAAGMAEVSKDLVRRSTFFLLALLVAGFGLSVLLGVLMAGSIARPLRLAVASAAAIAQGDLTIEIAGKTKGRSDEVGELARALEEMISDLNKGMRTIRGAVDQLDGTGLQLSESLGRTSKAVALIGSGIEAVKSQAIAQSTGVEETAATVREMTKVIENLDRQIGTQAEGVASSSASVEEMVGNIRSVAASVGRLSESFGKLLSASEDGRSKLDRVNNLIQDIASQSEKLQEANSAVSSIASKTNLLAMNAAIESAHAGDAGRGFAVVADEIRMLAESATTQSKEISADIGSIRHSIEEVVVGAVTAQEAFASVQDLIKRVNTLENEINLALEEQREGSRQVLEALAAIKDVSAAVRSESSELREGSSAIDIEMGELQKATSILREAAEGISQNMGEIDTATTAVSSLSTLNRKALGALEALFGEYVLGEEAPEAPAEES